MHLLVDCPQPLAARAMKLKLSIQNSGLATEAKCLLISKLEGSCIEPVVHLRMTKYSRFLELLAQLRRDSPKSYAMAMDFIDEL